MEPAPERRAGDRRPDEGPEREPTQEGRRVSAPGEHLNKIGYRLSNEEIVAKFNRACAYSHVDNAQRGEALAMWSDLGAVKDVL